MLIWEHKVPILHRQRLPRPHFSIEKTAKAPQREDNKMTTRIPPTRQPQKGTAKSGTGPTPVWPAHRHAINHHPLCDQAIATAPGGYLVICFPRPTCRNQDLSFDSCDATAINYSPGPPGDENGHDIPGRSNINFSKLLYRFHLGAYTFSVII